MVETIWWPNTLREHYSGRLRCSISHYKVDILRVNPYYELASLQLLTLSALLCGVPALSHCKACCSTCRSGDTEYEAP